MKRSIFLLLGLIFLATGCSDRASLLVTSPNIAIRAAIDLSPTGEVQYVVMWGLDTVVNPSIVGLVLDGDSLTRDLELRQVKYGYRDTTWQAVWGQNKTIRDHFNDLTIDLKHKPTGKKFSLQIRAHNDGVALRYILPENSGKTMDEVTYININGNPNTWWSYADFNTYEKEFQATLLDSASWVATPLVMRRDDGLHVAINEAAIIDYPDATLKNMGGGSLKVELTPWKSGEKVRLDNEHERTTPWRMITITPEAAGLLNSSTMLNLAPPCNDELKNYTKYCKPMTYVGVWWDFHIGTKEWREGPRQGATTYEAMRYIDFAARHDVGGVVVEGWNRGWDRWGEKGAFDQVTPAKGYDLRQVAEYANACNVRLIMHHETGGDIEGYEESLDRALEMCKSLGITALKTGHAGKISTGENHHGQQVVNHFSKIVEKAAQYNIALDMHEPVKGSGLERSHPNVMTREAVRGMEWEAWSRGNSPEHTTLLPFTRGMAGPTDYTPGIFDILYTQATGRVAWNEQQRGVAKTRVHSTLAHQLALMVTIYSPWVMAADRIDNYEGHPAFQFVRELNPDYDKTIYLDAQVGEYLVVARRTGDTWYIAGTTNGEAREALIPLYFLPDGSCNVTLYRDAAGANWKTNPTACVIDSLKVTNRDLLAVKMAAGGGFAAVVKRTR